MRWSIVFLLCAACGGRSYLPDPEPELDRDAGEDEARTCDVDLLFVVDNSTSMQAEQEALAGALPEMLRALDDRGIDTLRVAAISSDLGTAPYDLPTCDVPNGDDGLLATDGGALEGCAAELPSSLTYRPNAPGSSPEATGAEMACLTTRGVEGCGFEQPLEAALKALTPASSPLVFAGGPAHGDGANAGFLREDSILALVVVSDEDDCSTEDRGLFDPNDARFSSSLNLRCALDADGLHPVDRYVDGFRALRTGHADRLLVAALTGVPVDLVADPDAYDSEATLMDPRMRVEVMDEPSGRLRPACQTEGLGDALPGRRFAELTGELGDAGLMLSLCQPSITTSLELVVDRLAALAARGCE